MKLRHLIRYLIKTIWCDSPADKNNKTNKNEDYMYKTYFEPRRLENKENGWFEIPSDWFKYLNIK